MLFERFEHAHMCYTRGSSTTQDHTHALTLLCEQLQRKKKEGQEVFGLRQIRSFVQS